MDEGLFRKSTRTFATFVCMFFISVCKWVVSVCLKNCDVQILLLAWHSYKVRINPQLIFSEKSWKSIEIHCLSWDHCDYWLLSTNITNQSTIILLTKIGALSTYRLASRWLILIDMWYCPEFNSRIVFCSLMSGFLCHLADLSVFLVSVGIGMLACFLYSLLLLSEQKNFFCSLKCFGRTRSYKTVLK